MSQPLRRDNKAPRLPSLLQPKDPDVGGPVVPSQKETDPGYYKSDGTFITLHDCPRTSSSKAPDTRSSK